MSEDPEHRGGDAPCFAHELIAGQPVDPETARDVARFRTAERARLLELRKTLSQQDRLRQAEVIAAALDSQMAPGPGMVIAGYWPIRSELDLRAWLARAHEAGARIVLPVVAERAAPLIFREWHPRAAMTRGFWNIPVPAEGAELTPTHVIAPVLGIDRAGFRLGNGGGYYDRTLAALDPAPTVIGVGQDFAEMDTIFPMPWDVPMDRVVLGDGTQWSAPAR